MITDEQAREIAKNPDGCDLTELADLVYYIDAGPWRAARRLWGATPGFKPVITVRMIGVYCRSCIKDRKARQSGNILKAFRHEYTADTIYNNLPKSIRW